MRYICNHCYFYQLLDISSFYVDKLEIFISFNFLNIQIFKCSKISDIQMFKCCLLVIKRKKRFIYY
jgi:hypothetical protein